jgi:hypothetical protein
MTHQPDTSVKRGVHAFSIRILMNSLFRLMSCHGSEPRSRFASIRQPAWHLLRTGIALIIALGIIILAPVVIIIRSGQPSGPLHVRAVFLGYTIDAAGARLARIGFTNQSPVTITLFSAWRFETRHETRISRPDSLRSDRFLAPGRSEMVTVAAPRIDDSWRAAFHYSRDDWQRKVTAWAAQSWVPKSWVPGKYRGYRVEYAETDWIDP